MTATQVIVSLLGIVALLLWGVGLVSAGVMAGFGPSLRRILATRLDNRLAAIVGGTLVTMALQSSTATAMMVTSFTAGGLVALVPALSVMLGANLGTALIVQVLSFDLGLVYPLLIFIGYVLQRRRANPRLSEVGRILLGLGVILLSLDLLSALVVPLENAADVRQVMALLVQDPVLAMLIAIIFTFLAHSSVGAILFIMSLAEIGILSAPSTIAMVVGANIGSAINPLIAASGGDRSHLRLPVGNLANRVAGAALTMLLLAPISSAAERFGLPAQRLAPDFHLVFNLVMALVSVPLLPAAARLLTRLFPEDARPEDAGRPLYLDTASLSRPKVALANAAREVLRMADIAEAMLAGSRKVFRDADPIALSRIRRTDDEIDRLYGAVRRYLSRISQNDLTDSDKRRLFEILDFAVNIEHIGDIVDANLMAIAAQRIDDRQILNEEEMVRIGEMHERLIAHLRLAVSVLIDGDATSARQLVAEKERFRDFERAATEEQFRQILTGQLPKGQSANRYLDVVRDLKRIEAHIAATVYPLLERTGDLKSSRLA
ncbi:Na/Pi cotransporter family protein [Aureimonas altamirensis]|uniref:Na/Pi cotransporter family protein n=1 Tax=Aureimonas altamirensis TaxID=370622 RepID=UPI002036BEE8|nr:Na/Pi cotransporter family protein [Aureimonas altamirensis]MCM2502929.1 Na/Pi cotransporter family protein [Aureimonas altamirensis]